MDRQLSNRTNDCVVYGETHFDGNFYDYLFTYTNTNISFFLRVFIYVVGVNLICNAATKLPKCKPNFNGFLNSWYGAMSYRQIYRSVNFKKEIKVTLLCCLWMRYFIILLFYIIYTVSHTLSLFLYCGFVCVFV